MHLTPLIAAAFILSMVVPSVAQEWTEYVSKEDRFSTNFPGQPHPFVDNKAWRAWLDVAEAGTMKYVEDAKAGRIGGRGGNAGN